MRQWIRNARIVTGDGRTEPYAGDALFDGDRIAHLGAVPPGEAKLADRTIDARGRVLAPGFLDVHNHGALGGTRIASSGLPVACEMAIRAGVTRRVCGVDGLSPAPVAPEQRQDYAATLRSLDGDIGEPWPWSTVPEFFAWHAGRSVTDLGLHLGHSAVRRSVMGNAPRAATPSELAGMQAVVRQAAPHTLGLSTGLIYNPAAYADGAELSALLRAFNEIKPGALFPHIRSESTNVVPSLKEAVQAAVDGGGGFGMEHTKIAGERNADRFPAVQNLLNDAQSATWAMENMYPYTAGSTTGDGIFPLQFRAGTRAEFLARLQDPAARRAMYEWMVGDTTQWENFVAFSGGLKGIQVAGVLPGVGEKFLGKRLSEVAAAAGAPDPGSFAAYDAVFDFFVANRLDVTIITHYGNEPIMERFFRRKTMAICTDGLMPGPGQKPHPRTLGSFPRALRMAREMGIPLIEIVHRMTVMPSRFLRLESPELRPGADASVVLFDWEIVRERNSYEDPTIPPEGIGHVWVHGTPVLVEGEVRVPERFEGRVLRPVPA